MPDDTAPEPPEHQWLFSETGPALGEKMRLLVGAALTDAEAMPDPGRFTDKLIAEEIGMSSASAWSKAKSGKLRPGRREYVKAAQLQKLAVFFGLHLPQHLGPEAWRQLSPQVSVAEFEAALMRIGYGSLGLRRKRLVRPADELLLWMSEHCELTRRGIKATPPAPSGPQMGNRRGAGAVDAVTEAAEGEFFILAPADEFVVHIEAVPGAHVVLLQLSEEVHPPHYSLHCLLPSYRHTDTLLPPGGLLPSSVDALGRRGFVAGAQAGRFDLLAIVTTRAPLPHPFAMPADGRFHQVEPMRELAALKRGLQDAAAAGSLRIHNLPMRVV
jgi:hypothetical protein